MIQRLDRYVAGMFLSSWLVSILLFMGLTGVVDFFSNVDELLESAEGTALGPALVGRFYLYKAPTIFVQVAPFVMLMAALFTVIRLQRHNELMAMQLTGRRSARVLAPVFVMTVLCVGLIVVVQERVIPRVAQERDQLENMLIRGDQEWVIGTIRVKDARDYILNVTDYRVGEEMIGKLNVSGTDSLGRNIHVYGEQAVYDAESRGWRLKNGLSEIRTLGSDEPAIEEAAAFFPTDVGPRELMADRLEPFDLSYAQVLDLSERYPQASAYRLLRHYHITYPLSVLLLVLLGLPFVLRRQASRTLVGVGISLLLCMAYLILDVIVRDLGSRGFLSPVIAAWVPVIVAGSLGVVLFDTLDS
jgi:LPS export ABC transporter permease LptG